MTENSWQYDLLKDLLIKKTELTTDDIEELKIYFENDIGSKRRIESIKTLEDLLDVLERRDVVSEENIQVFKDIGEALNDENIIRQISEYPSLESSDNDLENVYASARVRDSLIPIVPVPRNVQENILPNNNPIDVRKFSGPNRERIYKLIASEIGRKWREFGRGIGIREGEMDEVESTFPRDFKSRVMRMLTIFEEDEREDPRRVVLRICDALEKCRRKDLSRQTIEILSR